jgi:endonuclease/exonuclease/phosphatase (EEP) superfamily protein YafD
MAFQVFSFTTNIFTTRQVYASQKFEKEIIIASFNKLYSNTNYTEIDKKIIEQNPDLLAITEMKRVDKEHIPSLNNYPYFLMKDARDGATISIFSKFPLEENNNSFSSNFVLPIKATINDNELNIFVLHPLPPATNKWTKERNEELISLANHINSLPNDTVILMGDFNLSPWSKSYKNITAKMPNMKNVAQGNGIHFTWHGSIIQTQIDHIFVGKNRNVSEFNSAKVNGSDHNFIWTKVNL